MAYFSPLLLLLAAFTGQTWCADISLSCPDKVPLSRFVYYSCVIKDGSGFLLWTVSGFQNVSLELFDTLQPGASRFSDGFSAVLTSTTNGIESVLSFNVTMDHDTNKIFCEDSDPNDKNISQCAVSIIGTPEQINSYKVVQIDLTHALITWSMPNGNSIIKDYEVSINGEKKRTNETEFLVLLTGLGNIITITITAIDNAERRGKEFTQLYDPSGPQQVTFYNKDVINSTTVLITWFRPNGENVIEEYEVSINGTITRQIETRILVSFMTGQTNIIIIPIDNAKRRGVPLTKQYNPLKPTKVDVVPVADLKKVLISWEPEPDTTRPAVKAYYISYTFNDNNFQHSSSKNYTTITTVDNENCKYTLHDVRIIAGNAIGNTTLFERSNVEVGGDDACDCGLYCILFYIAVGLILIICGVVIILAVMYFLKRKQKVSDDKGGSVSMDPMQSESKA